MDLLITGYDLRRAALPAAMPERLKHFIEAYRAVDHARLALGQVWADAVIERHPRGVERDWLDQIFAIQPPVRRRAELEYDIWTYRRDHPLQLPARAPATRALTIWTGDDHA